MGGTFSDPVPPLINQGYICFVLRSFDKLRVLHGNYAHAPFLPSILIFVSKIIKKSKKNSEI